MYSGVLYSELVMKETTIYMYTATAASGAKYSFKANSNQVAIRFTSWRFKEDLPATVKNEETGWVRTVE